MTEEKTYGFILYLALTIISLAGVMFLWLQYDVSSGRTYTILFLVVAVLVGLVLASKYIPALEAALQFVEYSLKIPLHTAIWLYLVGFVFPIIVQIIFGIVGAGLNVSDFSMPAFTVGGDNWLSLSAVQVQDSVPWRIFVEAFSGGVLETDIFNLSLSILGVFMAYFILKLLKKDEPSPWLLRTVGMVFVIGGFVYAHNLNNSYEGWMFVIAGIFILISTVSIYLLAMLAAFWIGYHQSNNLLAIAFNATTGIGLAAMLGGLVSFIGVLWFLVVVAMIYYLIRYYGGKR